MIKKVFVKTKTLHFSEPFQIAYETVSRAKVVIVKITDEQGRFGLGNACPDEEVTGEKPELVQKIMKQRLTPDFFSLPFSEWDAYHARIQKTFPGLPSAQSAVEEATINLWSQIHGKKPFAHLGRSRPAAPTMITIGIKSAEETVKDVKKRLDSGYRVIKIKCGLDLDRDLKRIMAVTEIIPKNCQLTLDANQGYGFAEAKKLLFTLKNKRIALIEQPLAAKDLAGMKRLHQMKLMPVVADEAVVTVADAKKILKNNYAAGVNIKLAKCGGPVNFIEIFRLAKSLNKIIMLGCMYESNISMTTGAHLATALPIDFVDLDTGHLDFPDDPSQGGAKVSRGLIRVASPLSLKEF